MYRVRSEKGLGFGESLGACIIPNPNIVLIKPRLSFYRAKPTIVWGLGPSLSLTTLLTIIVHMLQMHDVCICLIYRKPQTHRAAKSETNVVGSSFRLTPSNKRPKTQARFKKFDGELVGHVAKTGTNGRGCKCEAQARSRFVVVLFSERGRNDNQEHMSYSLNS